MTAVPFVVVGKPPQHVVQETVVAEGFFLRGAPFNELSAGVLVRCEIQHAYFLPGDGVPQHGISTVRIQEHNFRIRKEFPRQLFRLHGFLTVYAACGNRVRDAARKQPLHMFCVRKRPFFVSLLIPVVIHSAPLLSGNFHGRKRRRGVPVLSGHIQRYTENPGEVCIGCWHLSITVIEFKLFTVRTIGIFAPVRFRAG